MQTQSFLQQYFTSAIIAVLFLASLSAAVTLQLTGNDANNAWVAAGGFGTFFAGVHVPSPSGG